MIITSFFSKKITWRWTAWATLSRLLTQGCRSALLAVIRFVGSNSSIESISCFTSRDTEILNYSQMNNKFKNWPVSHSGDGKLYSPRFIDSYNSFTSSFLGKKNFKNFYKISNSPKRRIPHQQNIQYDTNGPDIDRFSIFFFSNHFRRKVPRCSGKTVKFISIILNFHRQSKIGQFYRRTRLLWFEE